MADPVRPPPPDDATRSWLAVVRAYHLCSEVLAQRLGTLGVRTAEHEILFNLRREPGLSQKALAARCFTAKSHASALLDEAERRGWVRREPDPRDGRVKRLFLTASGARLAERTAAVQAEVVALMTDGVPVRELERVRAAMAEVGERLQAALDAPPEREQGATARVDTRTPPPKAARARSVASTSPARRGRGR